MNWKCTQNRPRVQEMAYKISCVYNSKYPFCVLPLSPPPPPNLPISNLITFLPLQNISHMYIIYSFIILWTSLWIKWTDTLSEEATLPFFFIFAPLTPIYPHEPHPAPPSSSFWLGVERIIESCKSIFLFKIWPHFGLATSYMIHFQREEMLFLFCLPSEKLSTTKGNNLFL